MKDKGPLEKVIQDAILDYLWAIGIPAFHVPNHGKFNFKTNSYNKVDGHHVKGVPDLVAPCREGVTLYVEVKRQGEKPTPEQEAYHAKLRVRFHHIVVARCVADVRLYVEQNNLR